MEVHTGSEEALAKFKENLAKAAESGHWMAVCWSVVDEQLVLVGRTTFSFPRGDFAECVRQLQRVCQEEEYAASIPPPLPRYVDKGNNHKPPTEDEVKEWQ